MYQFLARVPGAGSLFAQLLRSRAFCKSTLGFGGCFYDSTYIDGEFHKRFIEPLIVSRDRIEGTLKFLRNMKFLRLDEFKQLHRRLEIPTLFIWGASDAIFPEPEARAMISQFPKVAGVHSIANAKLFFYEEHPQEIAQLIEHFVQ